MQTRVRYTKQSDGTLLSKPLVLNNYLVAVKLVVETLTYEVTLHNTGEVVLTGTRSSGRSV
jgi:hypothetical protein